jgi:CTP:molybdopterin cytidylyltransferase MocA
MSLTLVILAAGLSSRYGGGMKQTDAVGPRGETLLDTVSSTPFARGSPGRVRHPPRSR